jgi:hypothetical protein
MDEMAAGNLPLPLSLYLLLFLSFPKEICFLFLLEYVPRVVESGVRRLG